ncbi:MAG: hypothetical protein J6P03_01010 [Opitutales bacterium]|nr:hypothetical protein [Opitutales bacterium]
MANLTQEQADKVRELVNSGAKLGDIQKFLNEKFGLNMTYMEVRFMVDDLDLTIKDAKSAPAPAPSPAEAEKPAAPAEPQEQQGGVTVEISPVQRPGAITGGKVTFSDGVSANWELDADGRLRLDGADPSYRPSQADVADFQEKLRTILSAQY